MTTCWTYRSHVKIHPVVCLRPTIKPAEGNGPLQRCQDNLSSANYFNLEPGGPQSIHTACFDGYIGAPPPDPTMNSLCVQWFSNGIQPFPCIWPIPDTEVVSSPRRNLFLHFPRWALKVRWREVVDSCKSTLRSRNASFVRLNHLDPSSE